MPGPTAGAASPPGFSASSARYRVAVTSSVPSAVLLDAGGVFVLPDPNRVVGAFTRVEFNSLLDLAESGCEQLFAAQRKALGL